METSLEYAIQLLAILPQMIASGKSVYDLVTTGNAALKAMQAENRNPTEKEWKALNDQIAVLRAELHRNES